MRQQHQFCLLIAAALPATGTCQSLGYMDADSLGEAVGMMQATKLSAELMKHHCTGKHPEMRQKIESELARWRVNDQAAIERSDAHFLQMKKSSPAEAAKEFAALEATVETGITTLSKLPGEAGAQVFRQACTQHFEALASGVWRQRTPNVYKFLERPH